MKVRLVILLMVVAVTAPQAFRIVGRSGTHTVAAGGFLPSDVTNMVAWFDADAAYVTVPTNDVSVWADRFGTNDLTQTTATSQPVWVSSSTNFNNEPSVSFDGTGEHMVTEAFASPLSQPNTVFVCLKKSAVGGDDQFLFDGINSGNRTIFYTPGADWTMWASSNLKSGSSDTTKHIFGLQYNGASSEMYIDGGPSSASGNPGANSWGGMTLGARFSATVEGIYEVAEFLIYDALLTDSEMNQIGNFLSNKYNAVWTDL